METRGSHYGMLAQLAARNNVTREAALTAGSQSLLDFETKMLPYDGKTDTPGTDVAGTAEIIIIMKVYNSFWQIVRMHVPGQAFAIIEGVMVSLAEPGRGRRQQGRHGLYDIV